MSPRLLAVLNGAVLLLAGLLVAGADDGAPERLAAAPAPVVATAPPSSPPPAAVAAAPAPVPSPPAPRTTYRTSFSPYGTAGPVVLHFPVDVVELVGLHQSGHDGAVQQAALDRGVPVRRLDDRQRDTGATGAADLVVDPGGEVRAPVSGTVKRAGTYTLYCDHVDEYLVVEPDEAPGWEVKLLHFSGLRVSAGDRVVAGQTVVGTAARVLPFRSQVDDATTAPHWPHVHLEVVDPAVVDRRTGGGCD